mmetsp:Transcript_10024/g.28083  ORF Transcript_10024/g.28083 Transcript_10024/m.28083 type:complete len:80 (-) Transcript_10024:197-436(-)
MYSYIHVFLPLMRDSAPAASTWNGKSKDPPVAAVAAAAAAVAALRFAFGAQALQGKAAGGGRLAITTKLAISLAVMTFG